MLFSEHFSIDLSDSDEWFDLFLTLDTKLFIDPFLLYAFEKDIFAGSHAEVIGFFNQVFMLVAKSKGNQNSHYWKRARDILLFPEVEEICLGYTQSGTKGLGSGRILSGIITEALWEAVAAGLKELSHFEEIGILREGIGADRISDITANILRRRLIDYTIFICNRHGIPMKPTRYRRGYFDPLEMRWAPIRTSLPRNPNNGRPILLVPRDYLRDLPTIEADDFWQYCYSNENDTLRREFSEDVTRKVDKKTIVSFARRHPEIRSDYIAAKESRVPERYSFEKDPKGYLHWYQSTSHFCSAHPLAVSIASKDEFIHVADGMVKNFSGFVRNNRGWKLLWNDAGTPKREEASQLLFLGIVSHYCRANNIDISREADIGRGPVDFKISKGHQLRVLFEIKLAKNTRFWNGLSDQLPAYMQAEGIDIGRFVVILLRDKDLKRLEGIRKKIDKVNKRTGYSIEASVVDARYGGPPSASKL